LVVFDIIGVIRMRDLEPSEQMCVVCDEAITNPICVSCFEREVEGWLEKKEPRLVYFFKNRAEMFSGMGEHGVNCIICGKKMDFCVHCYGKEVYEWLDEIYPNKRGIVNEFLSMFDLNWHHKRT